VQQSLPKQNTVCHTVTLIVYYLMQWANNFSLTKPLESAIRTIPSQVDASATLSDSSTAKVEAQGSVATSRSGLKSPPAPEFTGSVKQYEDLKLLMD
jgi:hypothetical protein